MIDDATKQALNAAKDPVAMVQTMPFDTQQEAMDAAKYALDLQEAHQLLMRLERDSYV